MTQYHDIVVQVLRIHCQLTVTLILKNLFLTTQTRNCQLNFKLIKKVVSGLTCKPEGMV